MILLVYFASLLTVSGFGAFALWRNGIALGELRSIRDIRREQP